MAKHEKELITKKEANWLKQFGPVFLIGVLVGALLLFAGGSTITGKGVACFNTPNVSSTNSTACSLVKQLNPQLKISLQQLSCVNSCASPGKVSMLAFHSPTCPYCAAQEPVLEQLKQKYGSKLDITYVCTPIHAGDDALCQSNAGGKYLPYNQSVQIFQQLFAGSENFGTPVLVFDCEFSRMGSYSIMDQQSNTTNEYKDLDKIVSTMLAS